MNYSYSWTDYIAKLHVFIQQQDRKIQALEQRIAKLENSPSKQTTIEKIDYHFDQLKIEKLDGTLHIGVSPEGLSDNIDDLTVNNETPESTNSMSRYHSLTTSLDNYVTEEGPELLKQLAAHHQLKSDSYDEQLLLNDIRKQLPDRVKYYYNQLQANGTNDKKQEITNNIYEKVKEEILTSLQQFFQKQV